MRCSATHLQASSPSRASQSWDWWTPGASVTCLGFAIWWRYRAQWGALKPFESTVHGAHGKPLNIAGRTEHLDIQWGEARGRGASFIVIVGLESPALLNRDGHNAALAGSTLM